MKRKLNTQRALPLRETRRNLPQLLLQAREATIAQFRPVLNAYGVTEQQWRVIRTLIDTGPLEPRQIGAAAQISSPSMAGVLARMDALGLVERDRMAHDKRRITVRLTRKSERLAARMKPEIEAIYLSVENKVGADIINRLQTSIDELLVHLDTGDDGADS